MNRLSPILAFLAAACVAPSAAFAQVAADTGTIFVAAAGFADMRRAPTSEVLNGPDDDASGTVAGGALTLGVHLTPRLSVRAEWSLSDTLSLEDDILELFVMHVLLDLEFDSIIAKCKTAIILKKHHLTD